MWCPFVPIGVSAVSMPKRWPDRSRDLGGRFPTVMTKYLVIWGHANTVNRDAHPWWLGYQPVMVNKLVAVVNEVRG